MTEFEELDTSFDSYDKKYELKKGIALR